MSRQVSGTTLDVPKGAACDAAGSDTRTDNCRDRREAIWVVDAEGRTISGLLTGDHALPPLETIALPPSLPRRRRRALAVENFADLRQGTARRFDFRLVRPNGTEVWTLFSTAPIHDSDGNYAGALAMLTDITERHQADIALQQSEARLGEVQRLALMGNWALDVKTRVPPVSDELFHVIGVEPDQGFASFDASSCWSTRTIVCGHVL